MSLAMSPETGEEDQVLMFIDITRAHPHCSMKRKVWIKLPPEDPRAADGLTCGFLLYGLYGLRDAGQNFELFTMEVMVLLG